VSPERADVAHAVTDRGAAQQGGVERAVADPLRAVPPHDGSAAGAPPAAAALDAAAVRRVWSEILTAARQQSRSTGAMLVNATVRAVEGDVLVLSIASEPLARRLSETRNTDVVADALHAVLGVRWRVRCDHGDAAASTGPARPAAPRAAGPTKPARATPQRSAPVRPAPSRPNRRPAPDDGPPLPPEPPDDDVPPEDEEAMLAELAAAADPSARPAAPPPGAGRGPEESAIELLSAHLGAKTIDRR
jgi:DNA polymerase-3 subunit gamma/tau